MASDNSVCRICLTVNIKMKLIDNKHLELFERLTYSKLNTNSDAGMPRTVCYFCYRRLQICLEFSGLAYESNETLRFVLHSGHEITSRTLTMLSLATNPAIRWTPLQVSPCSSTTCTVSTDPPLIGLVKAEVVVKVEEISETGEQVFEELQVTPNEQNVMAGTEELQVTQASPEIPEKLVCPGEPMDETDKSDEELQMNLHLGIVKVEEVSENGEQVFEQVTPDEQNVMAETEELQVTQASPKIPERLVCQNVQNVLTGSDKPLQVMQASPVIPQKLVFPGEPMDETDESDEELQMNLHLSEDSSDEDNGNEMENMHIDNDLSVYCHICNKICFSKHNLAKHLKDHTMKKSYSCHQCDKIFTYQINLISHMRQHTREKPYSCITCNKVFARKCHYNNHMRVHTGKKPHTHDKKNNQKSNLTSHNMQPYVLLTRCQI